MPMLTDLITKAEKRKTKATDTQVRIEATDILTLTRTTGIPVGTEATDIMAPMTNKRNG